MRPSRKNYNFLKFTFPLSTKHEAPVEVLIFAQVQLQNSTHFLSCRTREFAVDKLLEFDSSSSRGCLLNYRGFALNTIFATFLMADTSLN